MGRDTRKDGGSITDHLALLLIGIGFAIAIGGVILISELINRMIRRDMEMAFPIRVTPVMLPDGDESFPLTPSTGWGLIGREDLSPQENDLLSDPEDEIGRGPQPRKPPSPP